MDCCCCRKKDSKAEKITYRSAIGVLFGVFVLYFKLADLSLMLWVLLADVLCFRCACPLSLSLVLLSRSTCGLRSGDTAPVPEVLPPAEEPTEVPTKNLY